MGAGLLLILIGFYNKKRFQNYGQLVSRAWLLFCHKWEWVEAAEVHLLQEGKLPNRR